MRENRKAAAPWKLAVVNDLAGYGRCSLTAAIPVISALKVQCCPVVTAVLSNHAGFPSFYCDDYTDRMEEYIGQWKKQNFEMDGILTGFLGSPRQAAITADFIRSFHRPGFLTVVDPVMGDHGKRYSVCSEELTESMKELIQYADLITPNLTEACFLTDTPYKESGWTRKELTDLSCRLLMEGTGAAVVTGVPKGKNMMNVICCRGEEPVFLSFRPEPVSFHGSGDIFAAVLAASMLKGVPLEAAVRRSSAFLRRCIRETVLAGGDERDGLMVENCLSYLVNLSDEQEIGLSTCGKV